MVESSLPRTGRFVSERRAHSIVFSGGPVPLLLKSMPEGLQLFIEQIAHLFDESLGILNRRSGVVFREHEFLGVVRQCAHLFGVV